MSLPPSLPTDVEPTNTKALTREGLAFLTDEGIAYAVVGEPLTSSVDVVARDPASLLESLKKFCTQTDTKLIGATPERDIWSVTLARRDTNSLEFAGFRTYSDASLAGSSSSAAEVLLGAAETSEGIVVAAPGTISNLEDTDSSSYPTLKRLSAGVRQLAQPTGLFVVFLGADGSGKSTVIAQVERDMSPAFSGVKRYHLRPHFGQDRSGSRVVTDPHAEPPRSLPASVAKLGLWGADYLHGYLSDIRRQLAKETLVIFDRYYADLLVDAKRYRYGGPQALARAVGWLIPRPDLVILLDAPAKVLQSRKQEVTFAETVRQRQAYLDLVTGLSNGHVVDASQPLETVVTAANTVILDYLAERTAARLGRLS